MDERTADHLERLAGYRWGKYRAIIRDRNDPRQLGRLRLEVPSLFDDALTGWAWPATVLAGAGYGTVFIPRVGDQVWVEFVEGDIDEPIWTAGPWASPGDTTELPQEAQEGYPDRLVIRTPGGHVIELGDDNGTVIVKHSKGAVITLDDAGVKVSADQVEVTAKSVTVKSGDIALGDGSPMLGLATKAFVTDVFAVHTHSSGIGPTGNPLPGVQETPARPQVTKKVTAE